MRCLCLFEGRSLVLLEQLVDPVEGARRDTRELLRAVADYGEGLATSGLAVREHACVEALERLLKNIGAQVLEDLQERSEVYLYSGRFEQSLGLQCADILWAARGVNIF